MEAEQRRIEQLTVAVEHRTTIGKALGILMERFGIGSERAFDVLRRYSQTRNVKLSVIVLRGLGAFVDGRLDRIYHSPVRLYGVLLHQIGA